MGRLPQRLRKPAWILAADEIQPSRLNVLQRETTVPASPADAFAFFADAANLERLTPPWLHFRILTSLPVAMRANVEIDYRIRLYGFPMRWRSKIDVWEPRLRFVDRQIIGPYRWWRHEHLFHPADGGTLVIDRVEYLPRASRLSGALVRRDLERIFTFRQQALAEIFQGDGSNGRYGDEDTNNRKAR